MSIRNLTYYPDPLLRKKAANVDVQTIASLQSLFDDMIDTMKKKDGIGLAAPQIGVSQRIIVINHADGPLVIVNPTLSRLSLRKQTAEEGCLSIPEVFGTVRRHLLLSYEGFDRNGKKIKGKAKGLFARVLQHEVDHINGVLFIDRVIKITHGTLPS